MGLAHLAELCFAGGIGHRVDHEEGSQVSAMAPVHARVHRQRLSNAAGPDLFLTPAARFQIASRNSRSCLSKKWSAPSMIYQLFRFRAREATSVWSLARDESHCRCLHR